MISGLTGRLKGGPRLPAGALCFFCACAGSRRPRRGLPRAAPLSSFPSPHCAFRSKNTPPGLSAGGEKQYTTASLLCQPVFCFFLRKNSFFLLFFFTGGKGSVAGPERRGRLSFFSSPPPASPCGRARDWSRARGAFGSDPWERTNGAAAERRKARPERQRGGAMI